VEGGAVTPCPPPHLTALPPIDRTHMITWPILAALAFAQTFLVGIVLVPLVRRVSARMGLVDEPTLERKIHTAPTPRSGGIALFAALWLSVGFNVFAATRIVPELEFLSPAIRQLAANVPQKLQNLASIFAGCLIIFVLGVADDRFNLRPRTRLLFQFLATVPVIAGGVTLRLFLPEPIGWAITALWLVGLTNSFNFLDNMNGLTSGIAFIIAGVLALLSALSREWYMLLIFGMIAGAALAFWCYNFPKGWIFLGDSGSTHLGFLLGALTIESTWYQAGVPSKLPVLMPLIILSVPLFDTASVMWIRWRTGKPLMTGDTNHVSHRLVALGFSRREAVLVIYGITLCVGLAAVALRKLDLVHGLAQTLMVGLAFVILHKVERVSRRTAEERLQSNQK
jgi:UDP-GlcNAc:undecaprenyl-phosphate GlcNAc-1-phosphate transferase